MSPATRRNVLTGLRLRLRPGVAGVMLCLAAFAGTGIARGEPPPATSPASQPVDRPAGAGEREPLAVLEQLQEAIEAVADRVGPSVVTIEAHGSAARGEQDRSRREGSGPGEPQENWTSHGAGVIIRSDGMILTSQHVIEGAGNITVSLHDGRRLGAVLIAADRRADLAVLSTGVSGLSAAELGDAAGLRRGRLVLAFGNALGLSADGQADLNLGLVSAVGRPLPQNFGREEDRYYGDMIQTNLRVSPGDSGGPLVDLRGRVIGIVTAMGGPPGGEVGIGFAVPIDSRTKAVVEKLLRGEPIEYGYLGVQIGTPTASQRRAAGLEARRGAVVTGVLSDSPASNAGLRIGDILVAVDGVEVMSGDDIVRLVGAAPPGHVVELSLLRASKRETIKAELGRRESPEDRPAAQQTFSFRGATLGTVDATTAEARHLPQHALVVLLVNEGSPADRAGLTPGDAVVQIQGKPVTGESGKLLTDATGDILLGLANGASLLVKGK